VSTHGDGHGEPQDRRGLCHARALEQFRRHVTTLVDVDVDALDDDELDRLVVGVQPERERLAAVEAMLLSRWDSRQV
jgi:hypothetical protein